MSAEYSVDGILAVAEAADNGDVRHPGMVADMLRAYAERIKADESAVPVAWRYRLVAPNGNRGEWFVTQDEPTCERSVSIERQPLFDNPPAQAAQVDRARETPRRQQAVEMLLELGWTYNSERGWEEPATTAEPVAQADTDSSAAIGPLAYSYRDCLKEANRPIASLSTQPHSPDAADSGRVGDKAPIVQQLRGRAAFLRDKGRVKSPGIMERAADALEAAQTAQGQGDGLREWSLRMAEKEDGQYVCAGSHGLTDSASPTGVPDGKCARCNGTGEYMDYRGNMSQMEKCYVCDGLGNAAPSHPEDAA